MELKEEGYHTYYIYIITNTAKTVLYTGVTNNIGRRIHEHKNKLNEGFTSRYNVNKLVYFQEFTDINEAIAMAKENPEFEYVPSATIEVRPIKMKEEQTNFVYPNK